MVAAKLNLQKIVSQLAKHYGKPGAPVTTDPFELILLENIAYLVSDERREEAFGCALQRQSPEVSCQTSPASKLVRRANRPHET